ncbi:MAG: Unknown protein [uncultured Thiotrichaceae bacterium]|uniref:ATP-binding protein n=1 Tax=uncultured Thiotrichaceae bacterium TaxID=298394 RepID=A0A6S6U985_9GAMM|nr:MAG: Unknown protein [uncultured Thiotrichaceae bacterium]
MQNKIIPANAGKLLNAVASIGYDVEVAICDLIDNSFDANAKNVHLYVDELIEDGEATNLISKYIIADDGIGMDGNALINAFTLGSDRNYDDGSLGKFGLGLKSAGLSLGDKIIIITKKKDEDKPLCATLSLQDVEDAGEYQISIGEAKEEYLNLWDGYSAEIEHGTVLIIDSLNDGQSTSTKFIDYLTRYCGQVYHMAIEDNDSPVRLYINNDEISPIDPLFMDEATKNGALSNIEEWNGKTTHLLIEDTELSLDNGITCTIAATNLVHPPTFEIDGEAERQQEREKYQVTPDPWTKKPRHGFYIYRNRRIIVMAERFHGLVQSATQAWAFRARLMFDESADNILALDVKKRHMKLPKTARNNLKNLVAGYQSKSINAWKYRGKIYSEWVGEEKETIANQSVANTPVGNLDYVPNSTITSEDDKKERKKLQKDIEKKSLESIQDRDLTKEALEEFANKNYSIVPSNGLKGNAMWLPYPSVELGRAETILNKQHSWVADALQAAEGNPEAAIILYQLLAIISRSEMEVRATPWPNISPKIIDKVFDIFRRKVSTIGEDVADSLNEEITNLKNGGMRED